MLNTDKRNRLLMLVVAGLGIGYLVLLGYLLWGDELGLKEEAVSLSPTPVPVDLWDAYEQARSAARALAPDAQLVSASTQWQAVSEDALLGGAGNWTLVFFSPADNHSLDVVANGETARVVNQTPVWVAPATMAEGTWRSGPQDAVVAFLACGGRAFLDQHTQVVVDLHLAEDEGGRLAWTVVALDPGDYSLVSVSIDAETGQVLSGSS
jgi:hypothetical protein